MNKRLILVDRALTETRSAIGRYAATDAENHLRAALPWLEGARHLIDKGFRGDSHLFNAAAHLQLASRTLGFVPVSINTVLA